MPSKKLLPRPPQWVKPRPRETLGVRTRREYKEGLGGLVEWLQARGWTGITTGLVLEHLMQDVITQEGWERIEASLRKDPLGFRPPVKDVDPREG
ncbi:hypothetical protein [Deinococcus sp. Marseille-Q6407]|uniref:hypothetical protein n=1 Tax=Deinococcus sp. Marseille-Q6407 TaxID=2969223 RepID=UPI0021BE19F1|nr:hypothetical protein [Deinococcus sp. Marseille-Q6407]